MKMLYNHETDLKAPEERIRRCIPKPNQDPFYVEIILALHASLQVKDLLLITGDYKHIVPRRELIKGNTSLKDVIGLGEFRNG